MKKILVAMLLIPTLAFAWEPTKPITAIVGYGPGSGNEICFRGVAAQIEKTYYHTSEAKMITNALPQFEYRDGLLIPK